MEESATIYEVMAAAISRELRDDETWFLGLATGEETILLLSCVPLVAMGLAQNTHAPNSTIMIPGMFNPVVSEAPTAMEAEFGDRIRDWRCEMYSTMSPNIHEATHTRGEVSLGFSSVAQVDKYGNCNIVCIGDYQKPRVRLIGPIHQPGHLAYFGREIIVVDHEKRNFVDRVDFISGVGFLDGPGARERLRLPGGGPCMILTNKALFDFHPETRLARLKSIHPGVSLEDVRENTGFTHDYIPDDVPQTPLPTPEEIRVIREQVDPRGALLPR
jgi:glutaconate CoA-transferase subunit B